MGWLSELNQWTLIQLISFIGIGAFFDTVTPPKAKAILAGHLSAKGFAEQKEFECQLISNLIEIFLNSDGAINIRRVFVYELFVSVCFMLITDILNGDKSSLTIVSILIVSPILAFFSMFLDVFSLYVSKRIFYYRYIRTRYVPFFWFADIVISVIPIILIAVFVAYWLTAAFESKELAWIIVAHIAALNILTSIILSMVQAIAILGGILVKLLSLIDTLYEGGLEKAAKQPMTLVFSLVGMALIVVENVVTYLSQA